MQAGRATSKKLGPGGPLDFYFLYTYILRHSVQTLSTLLKLCASLVGFCTLAGDGDEAGGGFWLHWIGSKDWKGGFPRGLLGRC